MLNECALNAKIMSSITERIHVPGVLWALSHLILMTLSMVNNIVPRFMCEEIEVQKGQESTLTKAAQQEDVEPVF